MKRFFKSILTTVVGVIVGLVISFFLVPIIFMMIAKGFQRGAVGAVADKSILHLHLRGQLVERHRPLDFEIFGERSIFTEDHTLGLYETVKALELAANDKRISGVFIEIRDFDAGWAGVSTLRRQIEEFTKSGKWVFAYADQYDELTYYLASAASQVFIEPHGDIELNGLGIDEPFMKNLFTKLQVEPRVFKVGKFKAATEPFTLEKMSEENRTQTQALVEDLWQGVRSAAARVAKVEEARVDAMTSELEVVSAEDAKKAGLVHELAFIDEVEGKMRKLTLGEEHELELVLPGRFLRASGWSPTPAGGKKKIAVIFADGEIKSGEGHRDEIGSETLRQDILDAKADENVAAIVLRINSPGGDALASDVIWRELRITDDELPVVVSMGDMAASGGYYIAAAGRFIYAEPTTITGSIGVFGLMFYTEKFFRDKTGVNFDRVLTHSHADLGNPNRAMTEFESKTVQKEVERVYKRFLDVVQEGRGYEDRSDLEKVAEGRVWSGSRAKELGLVDELGGLKQATEKAAEFAGLKADDYELELFPAETDPIRMILERFTEAAARVFYGTESRELLKLAASLKTRLSPGVYARIPFDMKIR